MRTLLVCAALLASCRHDPTAAELLAAGDAELADESVASARRAADLYTKALALSPPPGLQAKLHGQMAEAESLFDPAQVGPELERAVAAAENAGDRPAAIEYRVSRAVFAESVGRRLDALRALVAEARAAGDPRVEAFATVELAFQSFQQGRLSDAIGTLDAAEGLLASISDPRILFKKEETLAGAYWLAGDGERALTHIEPGLAAARAAHLPLEEAQLYHTAGNIHFWLREDPATALVYYTRVVIGFGAKGMLPSGEGINARMNMARAETQLGDREGVVTTLERTLALAHGRTDGEPNVTVDGSVVDVLIPLAKAYFEVGRSADALARLAEAAALAKKNGDDHRFMYAKLEAGRLAMREGRYPDALELARSTAEPMAREDAKVTDEKLMTTYGGLGRLGYQLQAEALAAQGQWGQAFPLSEKLRARRLLAGLGGAPLDAAATQALLGDDTVLVEYLVGEFGVYAFLVDARATTGVNLGPVKEVTDAAQRWYELVQRTDAPVADLDRAARTLADQIVVPLADRLHGRRVVIVPDKALHYVAFASLPIDGQPLVSRFELVTMPSASVLAALRARGDHRPRPTHTLAVLADPIFDKSDGRLGGPKPPPATIALRAGENLVRLPATHDEAQAIAALVPPDQLFIAEGANATRAAALGPEVASARFVHFATHAILDPVDPDRSALVLSGDAMRASDIEASRLAADLVVLSACRTAIGRRFDGEGLVGLTRAFLRSGVPRVVSSLWQVDDAATAKLMATFYRGMLEGKLAPAAALRQAQLAAGATSPRLWAGFAFQGDWR